MAEGVPSTETPTVLGWLRDKLLPATGTVLKQKFVDPMVRGLMAPGEVYKHGGTTEEMIPLAQDMLNVVAPGGAGMAERGAAGIFGGRLAKTADKDALQVANELMKMGAPRDDVWHKTGWFKDIDGQWKFEIPDQRAAFANEYRAPGDNRLASVLHHPDLFDAYPYLKDSTITDKVKEGTLGTYLAYPFHTENPSGEFAVSREGGFSTLLHELQHGIQHKEGFAYGGAKTYPPGFKELEETYINRFPNLRNYMDSLGLDPEIARMMVERKERGQYIPPYRQTYYIDALMNSGKYNDFLNYVKAGHIIDDIESKSNSNYKHLAGEEEARNVQGRVGEPFSQILPPWYTSDVYGKPLTVTAPPAWSGP